MSMGKSGGGSTVETSSDIPERYRDFVDGNLALAGTVANRPYISYQGPRIAGFTPDQQAAFGVVRGLGQQASQPLNIAGQAYGAGLSALSPFMNNANAAYTAGINSAADPSMMMKRYSDPYTEGYVASRLRIDGRAIRAASARGSRCRRPSAWAARNHRAIDRSARRDRRSRPSPVKPARPRRTFSSRSQCRTASGRRRVFRPARRERQNSS